MASHPSLSTTTTGNDCAICLEAMTKNLASLPCGHVFHSLCVLEALVKCSKCPVCRRATLPDKIVRLYFSSSAVVTTDSEPRIGSALNSDELDTVTSADHPALSETFRAIRKDVQKLMASHRIITNRSTHLEAENLRLRQENLRLEQTMATLRASNEAIARDVKIWKRISTKRITESNSALREKAIMELRVRANMDHLLKYFNEVTSKKHEPHCDCYRISLTAAKVQLQKLQDMVILKSQQSSPSTARSHRPVNTAIQSAEAESSSQAPTVSSSARIAKPSVAPWRERNVSIKKGELIVTRKHDRSIKAKVDLLDHNVRITFHEQQSLITIANHGKDIVLDCHTTEARHEWLAALFSAKEELSFDCEGDVLLSGDELERQSSVLTLNPDDGAEDESSRAVCESDFSDALQALQEVRTSMIQCELSMSQAKEDLFTMWDVSMEEKHHHIPIARTQEEIRRQCITAAASFIENVAHGGRAILLHMGVLASAGIKVEDILRKLGERSRDKTHQAQLTSSSGDFGAATTTTSMRKLYIATFVRHILFHPVYSKRPEVKADDVSDLIDKFFPHCRLRRFSNDIDSASTTQSLPIKPLEPIGSTASKVLVHMETNRSCPPSAPPTSTKMTKKEQLMMMAKRHRSYPYVWASSTVNKADNDKVQQIAANSLVQSNHGYSKDLVLDDISSDSSDLSFDVSTSEPLRGLFWKYSCQEIAEQLTIFHQQQLANMCIWDFVHSPKETSKHISAHFNRLVNYFVWSVLVEDTPKDRAEVIENIISIALVASAPTLTTPPLNNFNLVMACLGCLGDTPLMASRLPITWKKVRPKFKSHLQELRKLCDHSGGFENLRKRQAIESFKSFCIPFIGVIGVALERLRSRNYFTKKKQLDLEKLTRQYMAVQELEAAIQKPYTHLRVIGRLQAQFGRLSMDFATSRLLQLRSQQILANETQEGSSRTPSFLSPHAAFSTATSNSRGSGEFATLDTHQLSLPCLSFRDICSILASVKSVSERVQICLEVLFADERQQPTRDLRKFWLDFKRNVCTSSCHVAVSNVRACIDALLKDILVHKMTDLMQISGLEENDTELHQHMYRKLVEIVTQPIYTSIFVKIKQTFASEEAKFQAVIEQTQQIDQPDSCNRLSLPICALHKGIFERCSSPIDVAIVITQFFSQNTIGQCLQKNDKGEECSGTQYDRHCHLQLVTLHRQGILTHPLSISYLLQQLLDVAYLSYDVRDGVEKWQNAILATQQRHIATQV